MEFENVGSDEGQNEINFDEFPDCELFVMSESDIATDSETEQAVRELNGEAYHSKQKKAQTKHHKAVEADEGVGGERNDKKQTDSATSEVDSISSEGAEQHEAKQSDDTRPQDS